MKLVVWNFLLVQTHNDLLVKQDSLDKTPRLVNLSGMTPLKMIGLRLGFRLYAHSPLTSLWLLVVAAAATLMASLSAAVVVAQVVIAHPPELLVAAHLPKCH
jgi:hypothetical protein